LTVSLIPSRTVLAKLTAKNEMGGVCSTYGEEERCIEFFGWGNLRERGHLGNPGIDGRIILKCIFKKWYGGVMGWIDLAQDRDRWRALINWVMKYK
jgi:hypothetical protein